MTGEIQKPDGFVTYLADYRFIRTIIECCLSDFVVRQVVIATVINLTLHKLKFTAKKHCVLKSLGLTNLLNSYRGVGSEIYAHKTSVSGLSDTKANPESSNSSSNPRAILTYKK